MISLCFDNNNLEFSYFVGISIWLPVIFLIYFGLKFLVLQFLAQPQSITKPREREIEIAKNKELEAYQADDLLDESKKYSSIKDTKVHQDVLQRFRQRQKKIQRGIPREEELRECYVAKAPRLRDGDLEHFSHRHPLLRFHLRDTEGIKCNMCTILISGVAYGCDHCHYFLHEVCSNIPKRIRHDFHPMHSLNILPISSSEFHCVACGYDNSYPHHSLFAFYYHCDLCKFDLHLECASVPTKLIHKVEHPLDLFTCFPLESEGAALFCDVCNQVMNTESSWLFYNREFDYICHFECAAEEEFGLIDDGNFLSKVQKLLFLQKNCPGQKLQLQPGEVAHFSHRHPLKPYKNTNQALIMTCLMCSNQSSPGYFCQSCNYFIDELCFPFPQKIQHHYHPNHPLILTSYTEFRNEHCSACTQLIRAGYYCAPCGFSLHHSCAGAPLTLTLGTQKRITYKLLYSYPYEGEMADIKCSDCSNKLNSKERLYYNFDLDEVLHVKCALDREAGSYTTKFHLACERLKYIKVEKDSSFHVSMSCKY